MDYGQTFKRLREDKGLKIIDLEQSNISRSLIGKFEKGQSRISADRLDKLLADMGVNHDEFLFLGGDANNNYLYSMIHRMGIQAGDPKEFQRLDIMIQQVTNDLKNGRGGMSARFMREFGLMIRAGFADGLSISELYESEQVQKHVQPAVAFLKQAETWGHMELDLFMLFYMGMTPADLLILGRLAIKRARFYTQLRNEKTRLVDTIYTAFNGLLYVDIVGAAEMLLLEEQVLDDMDDFLIDWTSERIRLKMGQGLLKMMQGNVNTGYEEVMSVVSVYELVGLRERADSIRNNVRVTKDAIIAGKPNKIPHIYALLI
ncbi:helix-turn-helix domain-containing protein [Leuconostoc carnosum]|uniref:helix-turn-helix domain-containing protein n=1 Tax=Leuconostoc carnosum TaxID=1252 RepID=UPI00345E5402